jgi:SAM-dependent methyltransferase
MDSNLKNSWDSAWKDWAKNTTPWDAKSPNSDFVRYVLSLDQLPTNALDIGCGNGVNAIWLSQLGVNVTAIDVSSIPLSQARSNTSVNFEVFDFLEYAVDNNTYDFVFDICCLHGLHFLEDRKKFVNKIANCLKVGGTWLSISGSTEGVHPIPSPPRKSAADLVDIVEPCLEIVSISSTKIKQNNNIPAPGWQLVARSRATPPSVWIPRSSNNS